MNTIDIIEARKIKKGWSDEELSRRTGGKVSASSYSRHRSRETKPMQETIEVLMDAVGYKFCIIDKKMKGDANIDKWAIMSMWIQCNKEVTLDLFRKATGIIISSHYIDILKASLFYTWFYKQNKIGPDEVMYKHIMRVLPEVSVANELTAWGLITDKPSETAQQFYNLVSEAVTEYLEHANIINEITI